jgi:hypothetical protein
MQIGHMTARHGEKARDISSTAGKIDILIKIQVLSDVTLC